MDHESALDAIFAVDDVETSSPSSAALASGDTHPVEQEDLLATSTAVETTDDIFGGLKPVESNAATEAPTTVLPSNGETRDNHSIPGSDIPSIPDANVLTVDTAAVSPPKGQSSANADACAVRVMGEVWDVDSLADLRHELQQIHPNVPLIVRMCSLKLALPPQYRAYVWTILLEDVLSSLDAKFAGSTDVLGTPREANTTEIAPHVMDILRTELTDIVKNNADCTISVDDALDVLANMLRLFGLRWWQGSCQLFLLCSDAANQAFASTEEPIRRAEWTSPAVLLEFLLKLFFKVFTHPALGPHDQRTSNKGAYEGRPRHRLFYALLKYINPSLVARLDAAYVGWWKSDDDEDDVPVTDESNNNNTTTESEIHIPFRGCIPRALLDGSVIGWAGIHGCAMPFVQSLMDITVIGLGSADIQLFAQTEASPRSWCKSSFPLLNPLAASTSLVLPSVLMAAALFHRDADNIMSAAPAPDTSDPHKSANAYLLRLHFERMLRKMTRGEHPHAHPLTARQLTQEMLVIALQIPQSLLERWATYRHHLLYDDEAAGDLVPQPVISTKEVAFQLSFGWLTMNKLAANAGGEDSVSLHNDLLPGLRVCNAGHPTLALASFVGAADTAGAVTAAIPSFVRRPSKFILVDCRPVVHRKAGKLSISYNVDPSTCLAEAPTEAAPVHPDAHPQLIGTAVDTAAVELGKLAAAEQDIHVVITGVGVRSITAAYPADTLEACIQQDDARQMTLYKALVNAGCPRVSFLDGGFSELHMLLRSPAKMWPGSEVPDVRTVIIDHLPKKCATCRHLAVEMAGEDDDMEALVEAFAAVEDKVKQGIKSFAEASKQKAAAFSNWVAAFKHKDDDKTPREGDEADASETDEEGDDTGEDGKNAKQRRKKKVEEIAKAAKAAVVKAGRAALTAPELPPSDARSRSNSHTPQTTPPPAAAATASTNTTRTMDMKTFMQKGLGIKPKKEEKAPEAATVVGEDGKQTATRSSFTSFASKLSTAASATKAHLLSSVRTVSSSHREAETEHNAMLSEVQGLAKGATLTLAKYEAIMLLFPCEKVKTAHATTDDAPTTPPARLPRYLCIAKTNVLVLQADETKLGVAHVKSNRHLSAIAKISYSKKDAQKLSLHVKKADGVAVNVYYMADPQSFISAMQQAVTELTKARK